MNNFFSKIIGRHLFFVCLGLLIFPSLVAAQECPLGRVNDPAPGACGLYLDQDKNSICDLSESEKTTCDNQLSKTDSVFVEEVNSLKPVDHRLGLITIVLLIAYFISLFLLNQKKISIIKHRKIWNWLLLIFFIPTAITSIALALIIEFGWQIKFPVDLSYWHFVFGWAFLVVSFFHIFWHLRYYFKKISKIK